MFDRWTHPDRGRIAAAARGADATARESHPGACGECGQVVSVRAPLGAEWKCWPCYDAAYAEIGTY